MITPKRIITWGNKISEVKKGKPLPWLKDYQFKKGQHSNNEFRKGQNIGENNPNWKGGIYSKLYSFIIIRHSKEYKFWRESVFKRDDYTCQFCGIRGCYLEPHHKKSFIDYPELRFVVSNGITLCKKCHNKTKGVKNHNN